MSEAIAIAQRSRKFTVTFLFGTLDDEKEGPTDVARLKGEQEAKEALLREQQEERARKERDAEAEAELEKEKKRRDAEAAAEEETARLKAAEEEAARMKATRMKAAEEEAARLKAAEEEAARLKAADEEAARLKAVQLKREESDHKLKVKLNSIETATGLPDRYYLPL